MIKPVWIVDDDQSIRWVLEKALTRENIPHRSFTNPNDVLDALEKETPEVLISDIRMPRGNGLDLLQHCQQQYPKYCHIDTKILNRVWYYHCRKDL